jgi:hypothetical protein
MRRLARPLVGISSLTAFAIVGLVWLDYASTRRELGLGDRTGVWGQGFVRRAVGRVPPAIVTTPAGFFDDGVYDDPFASDLDALSGGVKHLFAGARSCKPRARGRRRTSRPSWRSTRRASRSPAIRCARTASRGGA